MEKKSTQLIDGCMKFVAGGKLISQFIHAGLSEECVYSEQEYIKMIKPFKPISCVEKLRKKLNFNLSSNSILL